MLKRFHDYGSLGRLASRELARPFDALDELRREMNRLFYDFESGLPGEAPSGAWPRASLEDTGSELRVRAEVPGLSGENIEVSVEESSLTLKGEREDKVPEGYSLHRKERGAYRFARSFALPVKVNADQAQAVVKNGILTVTLPKAPEAQPRQINVQSS